MNGMILIEMLSGLVVAIGGMTGIFAWSRRRMRRSGELAVVKAVCDGKTERHEVWQAAWWTLGGPPA